MTADLQAAVSRLREFADPSTQVGEDLDAILDAFTAQSEAVERVREALRDRRHDEWPSLYYAVDALLNMEGTTEIAVGGYGAGLRKDQPCAANTRSSLPPTATAPAEPSFEKLLDEVADASAERHNRIAAPLAEQLKDNSLRQARYVIARTAVVEYVAKLERSLEKSDDFGTRAELARLKLAEENAALRENTLTAAQARALLDVVTSSEMVQGGLPYGTTAALRRLAGGESK